MSERHFDIAVVGGGMVGAALALGAAREGFRVALLERREPPLQWPADSHDLRVSALTRVSQLILQNLDVWPAMVRRGVTAYEQMHVWEARGLGEIHFDAADIGEPDLGHIVENRVIVAGLWEAISRTPNVEVILGREVADLKSGNENGLSLADGTDLRAELLVGADGARSRLRELAEIGLTARDYDQHALVATVRAEHGNQSTAWQRFMPKGPLALLPLQDDLFSIVWSTEPVEAAELRDLEPAQFDDRLTLASERRCGRLSLLGDRALFPLRLQHANAYVRPGLALVGDAAHVIHPLAGQGVNLGLLDAGVLVDTLVQAREHHEPLGALGVLRRYERARKGHNLATQMAMDAFKHLFCNQNPALHLLRNLGLGMADRIPPLRRQFERVALGQGIELPSLARIPSDC
ncbi:MAG: FAD-dependent oxidoreductase [Gammaproteobacteria bacterium]|nr:MAG: FAD-dependent oxidoreductase [Gammaproteobacteria bacterium]